MHENWKMYYSCMEMAIFGTLWEEMWQMFNSCIFKHCLISYILYFWHENGQICIFLDESWLLLYLFGIKSVCSGQELSHCVFLAWKCPLLFYSFVFLHMKMRKRCIFGMEMKNICQILYFWHKHWHILYFMTFCRQE